MMSKSKAKILSLPITNHANYNAETERQENVIGAHIDEHDARLASASSISARFCGSMG